jgi:integrase
MPPANTGFYYQLADGTFGVKYRLPDGSQRKRSGFKNKTAARRWHAENVLPIVHGHRRGEREDLTFRELVDLFLSRHGTIRSARTIRTLRERLARPLEVYGDVKLSELETMALELAGWRATLPPRFAPKVMGAFRQVLAAGVRWRLIASNPAVDAGPNPEAPPAPVRVFTAAELTAIADELPPAYRPLPAFGAATGLRPEEWSALERRHVDRTRRLLRVEQKNVAGTIVPGTKRPGDTGREVPLTRAALAALDLIPPRLDTTLLFPAAKGQPLDLDNFRKRVWVPAIEAAGVTTPATPYDMRDTFASTALAAGVTVFELAKIMGTSGRMIEKHYGALVDGAHAAITDRLDALEARRERLSEES